MSHNPDVTRLEHMVEAVREILDYVHGRDLEYVRNDRPLYQLIIRDLEVLGEAASRVSQSYREAHPEVPWRDMIDLRNRLIHAYFDVDLDIVWKTVQHDLPALLPVLIAAMEAGHP